MKSEEEVLEILTRFLESRLNVDTADLSMDTELESLGIDSLMQMELVFDFEDKFGFQMPDMEDRPTTIGGLVKAILANLPQTDQ
jgi:acyl carrier protein